VKKVPKSSQSPMRFHSSVGGRANGNIGVYSTAIAVEFNGHLCAFHGPKI
jgi:hypothetical protein